MSLEVTCDRNYDTHEFEFLTVGPKTTNSLLFISMVRNTHPTTRSTQQNC